MNELAKWQDKSTVPGLWPIMVDTTGHDGLDSMLIHSYTLGALSDSMYEYLPKSHLMFGAKSPKYKKMWLEAVPLIVEHLLYRPMLPDGRDILLSGSFSRDLDGYETFESEAQHLACFQGGMFALSGKVFDRPEDIVTAEKLTDGCVWGYETAPLGIMPETLYTMKCADRNNCPWDEDRWERERFNGKMPLGFVKVTDSRYILRPEAIESVFILWRITGNPVWREKGWNMFTAIREHTRTNLAHSALDDVMVPTPSMKDEMESFWLAETLKYFYLLFADPDLVSLDDFVL